MAPSTVFTAVFLSISLFFMASCSTRPLAPGKALAWQQRTQIYAHLTDWRLKGRLGLRTEQDSGAATLIWDETADGRKLRLLGPAGQGLVSLEETPDGAVLKDRRKDTWRGASSQALIEQATGWNIPVASLRWWVLGIIEPGSDADYLLDGEERLASLSQDGWQVSFSKYRYFGDYELPGLITFNTDSAPDGTLLRGKYVLKEWEPVPR